MNLIDQILNWAALLLWLSWRSVGLAPALQPAGPSLLSTLKRAEPRPPGRWIYLAAVLGILAVRSFFYWHIGSQVNWTPTLDLGSITLPFRSDRPRLMVLFSLASFGLLFATCYAWLLLVSSVNGRIPNSDRGQRLIRLHLGWIEPWPAPVKLFLPLIVPVLFWVFLSSSLVAMELIPAPISKRHLWEQGLVLGLSSLLAWKFLVLAILILHLLNSYVYLGRVEFLNFASQTARNLLAPISGLPLRVGRVDLVPLLGILAVWGVAEGGARWLPQLFRKLPL